MSINQYCEKRGNNQSNPRLIFALYETDTCVILLTINVNRLTLFKKKTSHFADLPICSNYNVDHYLSPLGAIINTIVISKNKFWIELVIPCGGLVFTQMKYIMCHIDQIFYSTQNQTGETPEVRSDKRFGNNSHFFPFF